MARLFDAAVEKVVLSNIADADAEADFTAMSWIFMTAVTQDCGIQHKMASGLAAGWMFWFDDVAVSGNNRMGLLTQSESGTAGRERIESSGEVAAGEWNHWAVVRDNGASALRIYKNGVLDNTESGISNGVTTNSVPVEFGVADETDARQLLGYLAHCCFNNVVLTIGEIAGAMRRGWVDRSLVYHLPLPGLASPEPDWSGNKHNGTVTGATLVGNPPMAPYSAKFWGHGPLVGVAAPGARPQGPLGHPLHGPLAGPIAA